MDNEKGIKVGDQVKNKQTGQVMEVTKIYQYYEINLDKQFDTGRVECEYWESNKDSNTLCELNINEIEPID